MLGTLILRLFVKTWKKAIAISDTLPTRAWNTILVFSILLVCFSLVGVFLRRSSHTILVGSPNNIVLENSDHNNTEEISGHVVLGSAHSSEFIPVLVRPSFEHPFNWEGWRGFNTQAIDPVTGSFKTSWSSSAFRTIANYTASSPIYTDLLGSFRTVWDSTNLYVLVQVTDECQQNDPVPAIWSHHEFDPTFSTFFVGISCINETSSAQPLQRLIPPVSVSTTPTITGFSWNRTPTAGQPFNGTISGTNFIAGATRVFFCTTSTSPCWNAPSAGISVNSSTSLSMINTSLGDGSYQIFVVSSNGAPSLYPSALTLEMPPPPNVPSISYEQPDTKTPPPGDALFWISVFNMITSTLNLVWTGILAWISHNRARAELMLNQRELELKEAETKLKLRQMELEILKLEQEIARARSSPLIVPGF